MKSEKNLISLKEAAQKTGYSADYIGQLIRAGKIPGKQVYSNIAWMTTADAVMEYKNKGKNHKMSPKEKFALKYRKIAMEMDIIRLFFQTFKSSLPILAIIIVAFITLSVYLLHISVNGDTVMETENIPTTQTQITF